MLIVFSSSQYETVSKTLWNSGQTQYNFIEVSGEATASYAAQLSRTRRIESERRHLAERQDALSREVNELEVQLGISQRWEPSDSEYIAAARYLDERSYHRALDELQRLVVQRLFELQKLNVAKTGIFFVYLSMIYLLRYIPRVQGTTAYCQGTPKAEQSHPKSRQDLQCCSRKP